MSVSLHIVDSNFIKLNEIQTSFLDLNQDQTIIVDKKTDDFVIVLCGGKCGGCTLTNTFLNNNFKTNHLHASKTLGLFGCSINGDLFSYAKKIIENNYEKSDNENIYIIDSYRTPIERRISAFFQNISISQPNYLNMTIYELIDFFNEKYLFNNDGYHPIDEALFYHNIPLFNTFDFTNRYNIVKKDNIFFIKILFKDIHNWNNILSKIFNSNIVIHDSNKSEYKDYNELYKQFKKIYKVPKTFLNDIYYYDTGFSIYNTKEEQKMYINEWLKKSYDTNPKKIMMQNFIKF